MNQVLVDNETIIPLSFLSDLEQSCNVYDIIAACYIMLLKYKKDDDKNFVLQVGHLSEDRNYGSFAEDFENFRQKVLFLTEKINANIWNHGIGLENFRDLLICELKNFQCPKTINKEDFISLCMFYTIEAIDIYVEKNIDYVCESYRNFGPLNEYVGREHCAVFLQERSSFVSVAYNIGKDDFRKPLRHMRIGAFFHAVIMIECKEFCAAVPKIVPISLSSICKHSIRSCKKLRIVSIPYIGFETFKFCEVNNDNSCKMGKKPNGLFYAKYTECDSKDNICKIIALLELAIKKNANVIIFPEFIMSGEMLNAVKDKLRNMEISNKEHLFMVFAGTHYQYQIENNNGNNIMHILSANGSVMGRYYKYSPFITQAEEQIHGTLLKSDKKNLHLANSKQNIRRTYLDNCEFLSDRGKECTLFDIELIGRVLPSICRDVIDGKYTNNLTNIFWPSLLMVSAWSPSISSFDSRFSEFAKTIHTSSLLCNCCNAVIGEEEKSIGMFIYPAKQDSCMNAIRLDIVRKQSCTDSCSTNGGCVTQIDIDFSNNKINATQQTFFLKNSDIIKVSGDENNV